MTAPMRQPDHLGQALVNWLWAFYFFAAGWIATLSKTAATQPILAQITRAVLASVGGAALIVCTRTVWRELRLIRRPHA